MSGALSAGAVYVSVSAAIGDFTKKMAGIVKSVEQTAARVRAAAAPLADVGRIFAVGMGGAVVASAKSNAAIRADLDKLTKQLYTLAAEIGDAFGPFLKKVSQAVGSLVGAFQRLSPATKQSMAHFVVFMASVGVGATVFGKAAGLVEGVAKVASGTLIPALKGASTAAKLLGEVGGAAFPSLGKAVASMEGGVLQSIAKMAVGFASVLIPVAAVAAAIAGLVLAGAALYEAFRGSGSSIADAMSSAWNSIKDLGAKLRDTLMGWWEALKDFLVSGLKTLLDVVAGAVKKLASVVAPLARGLGLDKVAGLFEDMQQLTGDKLLKDLQAGAGFLADKATSAANAVADGAKAIGKEVKDSADYTVKFLGKGLKHMASDTGLDKLPGQIEAKVKKAVGGLLGGPQGRTRTPENKEEEKEAEEKRKAFAKEMAELQQKEQDEAHEELIKSIRADEAAGAAAFKAIVEEAQRVADEARGAMRAVAERIVSSLGDLGSILQNAVQAGEAAGPGGALVAVMGDLLARSTQFQHLVEVLNGIVGMVADAVGKIAEPFIPLLGAISMLVKAGLDALAPAFQAISAMIQPLVPPLVVLGELFQALAPIIALVVQVMTLILNPLQLFAGPVMHALFDVLKFVSRIILTIAKAVGGVWNGIVGAVQSVLRTIGNFSIFGKKPLGFLADWADGLDSARINTDAMAASIQALSGLTWDQAQAVAAQTAETVRNRQELAKANEELSNVPSAFKVALRRFQAQDTQTTFTGAGSLASPAVPVPTSAPPASSTWSTGGGTGAGPGRPPPGVGTGPSSPGPTFNINTQINATNPAEAMSQYQRMVNKVAYKLTGSRGLAGRYATTPEGA